MVAKNWKYGLAGGVVVVVVLLLILMNTQRMPWADLSVWEAIPHSSAIMLHTTAEELHYHHRQFGSIPGLPGMNLLAELDSALVHLGQATMPHELVLAGWNLGSTAPSYIVSVDLSKHGEQTEFWLKNQAQSLSMTPVRGHDNTFLYKTGDHSLMISANKNLLLITTGSLATEAALHQLRSYRSRITRKRAFKRLQKLHQGTDAPVLFIQWDQAGSFAGPMMKPGYNTETASGLSWMSFTLPAIRTELEPGQGYWQPTYPRASMKQLASIQPGNWDFSRHIPRNAMQVLAMSHSEDSFPEVLMHGSSEFFRQYIKPWLGSGAALVTLEPLQEPVRGYQALVLDIGDEDLLDATLGAKLLESSVDQVFDHREYSIFMLEEPVPVGALFGETQNVIYKPYAVKRNGVVILANHLNHLRQWLDALDLEQDYLKRMPDDEYLFAWQFNPGLALNLPDLFARDPESIFWTNYLTQMEKLNEGSIVFQYHRKGFEAKYRGFLSADTVRTDADRPVRVSGQLWQTEASAEIVLGPLKVTSIAGSIKIMAQDSENRLYAWHTDGTLHWSRRIDGKILSEVVLTPGGQLMFNTAERVYQVRPEDGANAGGNSPFALPAKTAAGMLYNTHRRDGSFYIFAENGNVYGFQADGLPLSRMRRKEAGVPGFQPVSFVSGGVFHMVMKDRNNQLHCFDETGRKCFNALNLEGDFNDYLGVDIHPLTRRIVMSGTDGRILVTNLEGLQFRLLPAVSGSGKRHFVFADFGSDTRKDYLVASDTHLALHAYEGSEFKKLWEYKSPHHISRIHVIPVDERPYPLICIEMGRQGMMILNEKGEPVLSKLLEGSGKPVILGQDVIINRNGQLVSLRLR